MTMMATMSKRTFATFLLFVMLIAFDSNGQMSSVSAYAKSTTNATSLPYVRSTRSANPFYGLVSIWNTLTNIQRLFINQKTETQSALRKAVDIFSDGFSDTATKKPTTTTEAIPDADGDSTNSTTTTTTERYRISRRELGYILGRNYRGLQKLFRIELNEALNHSKYSIKEYQREAGNALAQYTIPKAVQKPKISSS